MNQTNLQTHPRSGIERIFYVFILYCLRMTSLFVYCNVDRSTFSNVDRWRHTSHYICFCWPGVDQSRSSIIVSGITIYTYIQGPRSSILWQYSTEGDSPRWILAKWNPRHGKHVLCHTIPDVERRSDEFKFPLPWQYHGGVWHFVNIAYFDISS